MCFRAALALALGFAVTGTAAAAPKSMPHAQSGDQILARAVAAPQLASYSVPVHLSVHVHKPIGVRSNVEATAYYRAPAQAALVITHATGLAGGFFKGAYKIDLVPQAWPQSYRVLSVSRGTIDGASVVILHALPRSNPGDVTNVTFTLAAPALQPIAAEWDYAGGSTIKLGFTNSRVGTYTLPQTATIAVDMPHDKLDADGTYGEYALNAPVSDNVFAVAK